MHVEVPEEMPMFGTLLNGFVKSSNTKKDPFDEDILKHVDASAVYELPRVFHEIYEDWKNLNDSSDTLNGMHSLNF